MRKMRKKRVQPLNKILEVREKFLDFRKKSSDLKKSELEQKKLVIDENSKLIDSKIDNASKQRKNDFIDQKSKIDRKMVKNDVRTGKICNVIGMIASVSSCAISILGMISRFPNGITCVVLCSIFLFMGVAVFFCNTALHKHKNRFEEKENVEKKGGLLSKFLPKVNSNTLLLKAIIPTYFVMSVASNFAFFEKLVNDKSIIGWLTVLLFAVMLDIISFGLSGISDTFINLNYNSDTIDKIMNTRSSNSDNNDNNDNNDIISNTKNINTNNNELRPLNLNQFCYKEDDTKDETKADVEDEKTTEDKREDKSKKGRKKDGKNSEIASAICHDIKDKLANEEAEVLEKAKKRGLSGKELENVLNDIKFNKKIILKYLSDNIKKKYKIYTTTDIVKRIYDPTRDYLMANGYLKKNEETNRAVININYEKAAKCNEIIEKSKTLV